MFDAVLPAKNIKTDVYYESNVPTLSLFWGQYSLFPQYEILEKLVTFIVHLQKSMRCKTASTVIYKKYANSLSNDMFFQHAHRLFRI